MLNQHDMRREPESGTRSGADRQGTHLARQVPHVRSIIGAMGHVCLLRAWLPRARVEEAFDRGAPGTGVLEMDIVARPWDFD